MFDGSRWDRARRSGYCAHGRRGRWSGGFDVAAYALPLPFVRSYFEECEVVLVLGIGTRSLAEDVVSVSLGVELPAFLADVLHWTLPRRGPTVHTDDRKGWFTR